MDTPSLWPNALLVASQDLQSNYPHNAGQFVISVPRAGDGIVLEGFMGHKKKKKKKTRLSVLTASDTAFGGRSLEWDERSGL